MCSLCSVQQPLQHDATNPPQQIPLQREVVWYLSKIFRKLYPKLDIPIDIRVSLAKGLNRNNVIHDRSQHEFDTYRKLNSTKIINWSGKNDWETMKTMFDSDENSYFYARFDSHHANDRRKQIKIVIIRVGSVS